MKYIKSWGLLLIVILGSIQQIVSAQSIPQQQVIIGTTVVAIVQGDIVQQSVDAIVNAANEDLNHAGGVALAISKTAGPQLQLYCDRLSSLRDGKRCPTGNAVITPSFDLKQKGIKKIIHATGPRGDMINREKLLYDVYCNSLQLARDNGIKSLAFPAISTAIFGYDINEATPIAFKAVNDFLQKYPEIFDKLLFVVWTEKDFVVYKKHQSLLKEAW